MQKEVSSGKESLVLVIISFIVNDYLDCISAYHFEEEVLRQSIIEKKKKKKNLGKFLEFFFKLLVKMLN